MKAIAPLLLTTVLSLQGAAAQPSGASLDQVIDTYVHAYAVPSQKVNKIPRWVRGVCPRSFGLSREVNAGVAERVRLYARLVGAPVDADPACEVNVEIVFTRMPQAVLDDMAAHHPDMLGYHDNAERQRIATMTHPIQAWYATETRDYNGTLKLDSAEQNPQCAAVDTSGLGGGTTTTRGRAQAGNNVYNQTIQNLYQYCGGKAYTGRHLDDGQRSEFNSIVIVVDYNKIQTMGIRALTNYVAMLALSQTADFETCHPFASITNLMAPGCGAGLKPDSFSGYDIAYLSALYRMNPDALLGGQQSDIAHQMGASLARG